MTIQNTTRESVKHCAWCDRLCFNESEIFCSAECKAEAILGDHELAPKPTTGVPHAH